MQHAQRKLGCNLHRGTKAACSCTCEIRGITHLCPHASITCFRSAYMYHASIVCLSCIKRAFMDHLSPLTSSFFSRASYKLFKPKKKNRPVAA